MRVPVVGSSYQMDALSFAIQRSINFYPLSAEVSNTKEPTSLRSTPGTKVFVEVGSFGARGGISIQRDDRAFAVVGDCFHEIKKDGTSVNRGTLHTTSGIVGIESNGTQIIIVDGANGYIFTLATNSFVDITDVDFPGGVNVAFQDGYFIVIKPDSADFYISAINDGLSWDALDFTTVESNPDNLRSVISDNGNLWLFGGRSVEVYQNTGNAAFPFERISGAVIQTGLAATFTAQQIDNTVMWLGIDEYGRGVVWVADGYQARRISTQAIERILDLSNDFTDSYAWVYHERGHMFYCLQVVGLDTTLVYDVATGLWHERQYNGTEQHRGSCQFFFDNKNLVGDRLNGKIYELSLNIYDDDGVAIQRERIMPHLQNEKARFVHKRIEFDIEVGVGGSSEPQLMMQYSDDGGRTWSSERWVGIGKVGEYNKRVLFNRIGSARDRVYKIRVSENVFVQINGAYLNAT